MSESAAPTTHTAEPLKLVVVDQSKDAREAARDQADRRLDQELGEGGRFSRFVKGMWKGGAFKEYYRQKYTRNALDDIQESENVLTYEHDLAPEERTRAIEATIERFQSGEDEFIQDQAGERREIQANDSDISVGLKDMIRQYAEGALNDTTLREERTRFLQAYREAHGEDALGQGLLTTDNLLDVARAARGAIENGESINNVIANMQVITGEARTGVRTEARHNTIDGLIDRISKTRLGSVVGPETTAAAVAIAAGVLRLGSQSVVGSVAATVAPGAVAGVWAGLRENKRVKDERAQHAREMAQGREFGEGDVRREQMEQTRYESVSARVLTETLLAAGNQERLDNGGQEALQAAMDALAAVQSRLDLSDQRKIDLVSYSSAAAISDERMDLHRARIEVRQALEGRLTDEVRAELNIPADMPLSEIIDQEAAGYIEMIDQDATAKDRAFRILKARRVAKAAAVGVATGILTGVVAQEAVAGFDPTRAGLLERAWGAENIVSGDGLQHQTILEGMVEGDNRVIHTESSNTYETYTIAENNIGQIALSNDHELVENGDGTINLVDGNGVATIENVPINEDGVFPDESIEMLEDAGMLVQDYSFDQDVTTTVEQQVNADQYVQNHMGETTAVTRDLWYGNDTPGIYDQNELRVYRGGAAEAPGIIEGGFQYTVAGMHPDGSWQGGESVDWNQAAASGNLFFAVSGTVDTQGQVFMVPIGPDGAINISADSPAGQFFSNENGAVAFHGAYGEVVQTTGVDAEGVVHMRPLATMVGDRDPGIITDTVTTTITEHHPVYRITTEGYDTTIENFTEIAPGVPIDSRRSLEAVRYNRRQPEGLYGYSAEGWDSQLEQWAAQLSPRLRDNPDALLNTAEELDYYYEAQRNARGAEYINELESRIDASPELLGMNADSRAIVVMPVAAAQESENIYKALSLYNQQDDDAKRRTTVLLNLNWISDAENDPVKKANIDKTLAEVERARRDFPGVNIASFTKVWDRDWVDGVRQGSIYGEVIKTLYDTAALATRRAIKDGRLAADQDVLMITNDADALGMHRNYLQHYIEAEAQHKESDAFVGTIRWGVEAARDYPGYHISQLFMQSMNIAATRNTGHTLAPVTIGPNSAFRVSMYAGMGGCDDSNNLGVGADSRLGQKVLAARGRLPRSGGTYGSAATYHGSVRPGTNQRVVRQVIGSDIDSAPERLLDGGYRKGKFIPHAWSQFDAGQSRDEAAGSDALIGPEDPVSDYPLIRKRVESQISDFITNWYPDRGVASFTLSMLFPEIETRKGQFDTAWKLVRTGGGYKFTFTDEGSKRLKNSLSRDTRGRFDPIANRLQRRVYGTVRPDAAKQPVAPRPPLARPV